MTGLRRFHFTIKDRRGEAVPKLLQDKLVPKKKLVAFKEMNAWGQWSEISKQVTKLFKKRKEVNTPGLWQVRRKILLGIA